MLTLPFVDKIFVHGHDKTRMIEEFLTKHKKEYEAQLIGDLSHINHRAENYNGIQIEQIEYQTSNEYCMTYKYDWFVYNGCADMDEQDNENGFVCFTVGGNGDIEFDMPELEERSTYNEF
jgi:hypothetical protein